MQLKCIIFVKMIEQIKLVKTVAWHWLSDTPLYELFLNNTIGMGDIMHMCKIGSQIYNDNAYFSLIAKVDKHNILKFKKLHHISLVKPIHNMWRKFVCAMMG